SFEVKFTPALRHAGPEQGLPSDLVCPDPVERLDLHIGMLVVLDKKVQRIFMERIALADYRVGFNNLPRKWIAVSKLPGIHTRGGVILNVDHIATTFKNEGLQSLFTQFLGGPSATHSRAYYDSVKCIFLLTRSIDVYSGRILDGSVCHDCKCEVR